MILRNLWRPQVKGRHPGFASGIQIFDSSGCQYWSRLEASEKGATVLLNKQQLSQSCWPKF